MTDKELAVILFKGSRFERVRKLGEFIEMNMDDDKMCYARLFRKGYLELGKEEIEECIRLLLNSGDKKLLLKSLKYVKKEYYHLLEEIIPRLNTSEMHEVLRNVDSDSIRLMVLKNTVDEEIIISAIKRMRDKNLIPLDFREKYKNFLNEFVETSPAKDFDGEAIL